MKVKLTVNLPRAYENGFDEEGEPSEPDEGDYVIFNCGRLGGETCVMQKGYFGTEKHFADDEEAEKWIRKHAKKNKFYPSVWSLSDHGNYHLRTRFRY